MSLKDQAQTPLPEVSHLKQEKYPVYGLKWATLEAFLKAKFPNESFVEKREKDYFIFDIPECLTQEDKNELARLRDLEVPIGQSVTPYKADSDED